MARCRGAWSGAGVWMLYEYALYVLALVAIHCAFCHGRGRERIRKHMRAGRLDVGSSAKAIWITTDAAQARDGR
ncbi:hypothetical protein BD413DRAFT_588443 [Trametes elegans]|nr:hypothetical protein BD413DRAFT_588443 [Trametes elegans]